MSKNMVAYSSGKKYKQSQYKILPNDEYIVKITAHQDLCESSALKILNALHCFIICTLSDGSKIIIERGKSKIFVSQKLKEGKSIIGSSNTPKFFVLDLHKQLEKWCKNTYYHIKTNNCYDFCAQVCVILGANELKSKIIKAKEQNINRVQTYIKDTITLVWDIAIEGGIQQNQEVLF